MLLRKQIICSGVTGYVIGYARAWSGLILLPRFVRSGSPRRSDCGQMLVAKFGLHQWKSTKTLVNGVDIPKGAKYTAVSHTWSMWDNVSKDILHIKKDNGCEGTANFNDMVDFVNTEWVWIDTLCISESNKVTEIPNMRRYYKNAEVVLVVLDTSKGDYDLRALDVKDLGYRMDTMERMRLQQDFPERAAGECLQPEGVTLYNTLCKMFKAEWFKRGWTLQELLLAKDICFWNGGTSVSGADVRKCTGWLGSLLPDIVSYDLQHGPHHSLQHDEDYSRFQSIFHIESSNIEFHLVDGFMEGRRCTKDEDYVYSILGLLEVDIEIEYGIPLHVCKRRLFSRLVQEQRAASLFTHTGIGVLPIHNEYGTGLNSDYPRFDRVVYSLSREGMKFTDCNVYFYDIIRMFRTESFNKSYPASNLWEIRRTLGDDLSVYKELVKAMYCTTGTDDYESINTRAEWFWRITRAEVADVAIDLDCTLLHSLLTQPQTPLLSFGVVHNKTCVCAYTFTCLEAVPEDGKCLLLALGILGEFYETGILCSGLNFHRSKQQKIGATLNSKRGCLDKIVPVAYMSDVIVADNKF